MQARVSRARTNHVIVAEAGRIERCGPDASRVDRWRHCGAGCARGDSCRAAGGEKGGEASTGGFDDGHQELAVAFVHLYACMSSSAQKPN